MLKEEESNTASITNERDKLGSTGSGVTLPVSVQNYQI
jgi:hypothetical protein